MKATDIKPGKLYEITAGRNKTKVKVTNFNARTGSWECETESGKTLNVKDSKRFLAEVGKKPSILQSAVETVKSALPGGKKEKAEVAETKTAEEKAVRTREDGTLSGINAALQVLREEGRPMNIKEIMEKINERGLAKLNGKTPGSTVSAAMQREIGARGDKSRFEKSGKGLFAAR